VLIERTIARRHMATMGSFGLGSLARCFYGYTQNRGVRIEFSANREAALRWLGVGPGQQI
jgi:hypothetical protein